MYIKERINKEDFIKEFRISLSHNITEEQEYLLRKVDFTLPLEELKLALNDVIMLFGYNLNLYHYFQSFTCEVCDGDFDKAIVIPSDDSCEDDEYYCKDCVQKLLDSM